MKRTSNAQAQASKHPIYKLHTHKVVDAGLAADTTQDNDEKWIRIAIIM